jgi:hypothetical protein
MRARYFSVFVRLSSFAAAGAAFMCIGPKFR